MMMSIHNKSNNWTVWLCWMLSAIVLLIGLYPVPGTCQQSLSTRPTLVFIYSRMCPVCAKVMPEIKQLASTYSERISFVYLDVTDSKAEAASKQLAKIMHIGVFFNLYSGSFPAVGVFNRNNIQVHELSGFNSTDKY